MEYAQILEKIYGLTRFGTKLNLNNVQCLLDKLGNPERQFHAIHVGGSKGKGSVCAFLHSILKSSNIRAGLYTSPHLVDFTERIVINGSQITKEDVVKYYEIIQKHVDDMVKDDCTKQVTFFEFTTAMAFKYFADMHVDCAVIEVGLGGRLDATNVVFPDCSVITNIELEHTNVLGRTIEKIAHEKAGIIKPNVPVVTGARGKALKVISRVAAEKNATLVALEDAVVREEGRRRFSIKYRNWEMNNLDISLNGRFQLWNAALAVLCIKNLGIYRIEEEAIREGLRNTVWRGRIDLVHRNPDVIVDCAHTPNSAKALVEALAEDYTSVKFVFGVFKDKKKAQILSVLSKLGQEIIITEPDSPRAEKPEKLARIARRYFSKVEIMSREDAFRKTLSSSGVYCICGSVYLAGDAIAFFNHVKKEVVSENASIDWSKVVEILMDAYGTAGHYGEPFKVLIATILSQRTKDEITYPKAEALFKVYPDIHALAHADVEDVAGLIKPVGFYNVKAKKIIEVARILLNRYSGVVPDKLEELLSLPGVGQKTANCVLVFGFGRDALPVDTHVHRISNRLGVVKTDNPLETEQELKKIIPKPLWKHINYLFVQHGKKVCKPVRPDCRHCIIAGFCNRVGV